MQAQTSRQPDDSPQTDRDDILLEVRGLKMYFPVTAGAIFQKTVGQIKAVDDVSFFIRRGETLGLVGGVRLRQEHDGESHPPAQQTDRWRSPLRRDRPHQAEPGRDAPDAEADADRVPGIRIAR